MISTILRRVLVTTARNLYRHGLTTFTASIVIALLFVLLNGLLFVNFAQSAAVAFVNRQFDLALNFTQPVDAFQAETLQAELKQKFPTLRATKFISSEEAFTQFLESFGSSNPALASWLGKYLAESPLPATLVIAADASLHRPLLGYLASSRYAKILNLENPATGALAATASQKILALDRALTAATVVAGGGAAGLALLIIVAVLRLAMLTRREEIAVMRLVGATRAFVRMPFLLEGIFLAVVAAILGAGLAAVGVQALPDLLAAGHDTLVFQASTQFLGSFGLLLGWQILAAGLVGLAASYLATARYLGQVEV